MPASTAARQQRVTLPHTEVCMHLRIAGLIAIAYEEDVYVNWEPIPVEKRTGCEVMVMEANGVTVKSRHVLSKSECGWIDPPHHFCLDCGVPWPEVLPDDANYEPPCYCGISP